MAESTVVKNARDGTITVTNGTRSYSVSVEQGNLQISGLNEGNYETIPVEDRGEWQGERRTKRKYPTFTFTAWLRDLVDGADPTLVGMMLRRGVHAADVSTQGANAEVYLVDVLWTVDGTTHGDAANHTTTLEDCRVEEVSFQEQEDKDVVSISGVCRGAVTLT